MSGAPEVLLVGGCHRDVVARTIGRFEPGTSCPGRVAERPGGVARNVAVLLASAGIGTALASRVGDDPAGRSLVAALAAAGVAAAAVTVDPDAATGAYVAVHDEAGELVAAVSDMAIYDRIGPEALEALAGPLAAARLVFADANLPAATLDALAGRCGARLAVDAISRAKAPRVAAALSAGALGFLNLASASALAGEAFRGASEAAAALARRGARRLVVTGGAGPLAVLEDGRIEAIEVPPVEVADVTGAGDALTAGTLAALARGRPLAEATRTGILAAGAALSSTGALDRLPPAVLQALEQDETGA